MPYATTVTEMKFSGLLGIDMACTVHDISHMTNHNAHGVCMQKGPMIL